MRLTWRRLSGRRLDAELIALAVLAVAGGIGAVWLALGLPTPPCHFRGLTGLPCPTCGGTRCLQALLAGHPSEAAAWNPLVFLGAIGTTAFGGYAAVVTAFRLPRARIESVSKAELDLLRLGLGIAFAANWIYVAIRLARGV